MKIGCVPYLNAYPLWRNLPMRPLFAPPAELFRWMEEGRCDVALLPSIALYHRPDWQIVSNTCIASAGPVQSVTLFYRRPIMECRSITLDSESMTSNALLKIILKEKFHINLKNINFNSVNREQGDAFLLIGDKALGAHFDGYQELDLAQAWYELTGLPFVFALWLGKPSQECNFEALSRELEVSLAQSMVTLDSWVAPLAEERGIFLLNLKNYFNRSLQYIMVNDHKLGLEKFMREVSSL